MGSTWCVGTPCLAAWPVVQKCAPRREKRGTASVHSCLTRIHMWVNTRLELLVLCQCLQHHQRRQQLACLYVLQHLTDGARAVTCAQHTQVDGVRRPLLSGAQNCATVGCSLNRVWQCKVFACTLQERCLQLLHMLPSVNPTRATAPTLLLCLAT